MAQRRILVTGGTGFIGVPTTDQFVTAGDDVVVMDNFEVGERSRLAHLAGRPNLDIVEVDLCDSHAVERTVHEIAPTHVIHLAAHHFAPFCVAHPAETIAVNVGGTQHLLDALVAVEPRRIVFASTADVYRPAPHAHVENDVVEPTDIHGASKRMGERLLDFHVRRCPETDVVVCRIFNALGPGETNPHLVPDIMDVLRHGDEVELGNVETRRDYIFTGDMARALRMLADGPEGSFTVNLGTGRSWTAQELVARMADLLGRDLRIATEPSRVRAGDRPVLHASTRRLQTLLPALTITSLEDALRATLIGEGFELPGSTPAGHTSGRDTWV